MSTPFTVVLLSSILCTDSSKCRESIWIVDGQSSRVELRPVLVTTGWARVGTSKMGHAAIASAHARVKSWGNDFGLRTEASVTVIVLICPLILHAS